MRILIKTPGITLEKTGKQLSAKTSTKNTPINIGSLDEIWIHPETIFSGEVIALLAENRVHTLILDRHLRPIAALDPMDYPASARLRKQQMWVSLHPLGKHLAAEFILTKQKGQLAILRELGYRKSHTLLDKIYKIEKDNLDLLSGGGMLDPVQLEEAYFARLYFKLINERLPVMFRFAKRSRHPATDPFNALLNYGYGILYGRLFHTLRRHGLDPYIGFYHRERDGQPVLVYDVIEAFRPAVEKMVIEGCMEGRWKSDSFTLDPSGACVIGQEVKIDLAGQILKEMGVASHGGKKDVMTREVSHLVYRIRRAYHP